MLDLPVIDLEPGDEPIPRASDRVAILQNQVVPIQIMIQKLATQVLGFMALCGSPIKVFSSKPYIALSDWEKLAPDSNRHQWPEYNYIKGKVTDLMAKETVVAVPLLNVELEMPSDPVLHRTLYDV
jgi:hypothetical protein